MKFEVGKDRDYELLEPFECMEPNFEHVKPTLPKKNRTRTCLSFALFLCVHRPPLFFKDRISINRKSKCTFSQFETLHSRFSSKLKTVLRRDDTLVQ